MPTEPDNDDATDQFLAIIEAHKGILYKVTSAYSRTEQDRNDLVQEILYQLWRSRSKYKSQYAMSTWVYRIALNVSISALRKSTRRQHTSFDATAIQIAQPSDTAEGFSEELKQLHQFIHELREVDRALMLLFLDQKPHKEIALILGISESNVATRIHRIKASLKQRFAKDYANE